MAEIVLGIGSSHTPMLAVPGEKWNTFAERDRLNKELVFPPDGVSMSWDTAVDEYVPQEVKDRYGDDATWMEQHARTQAAIETLAKTLAEVKPDITVIISDDQDEWFFEDNMPSLAVYWGEKVHILPRVLPPDALESARLSAAGYGDVEMDIPVAGNLGRHVIEHLMDHDFDVAHIAYTPELYGGKITRRYPKYGGGETTTFRDTPPRPQGVGHGYSYVIKRLFDNKPTTILPVYQNTCYPPNHVRPNRAYDFGKGLAGAIESWDSDARVAVVASGGLSHFVVDEEFDRYLLDAILKKDEAALRTLPRHRLYSATSESLNWVAAAGAMSDTKLEAEVIDYVPVYRSEPGTGGGWAFARWM